MSIVLVDVWLHSGFDSETINVVMQCLMTAVEGYMDELRILWQDGYNSVVP
jgi:hypothetical protein